MALLGIQVQVDAPLHAQLWGDHHQESLARLQHTGVWAPTIVWMTAPPTDAYWQWAQTKGVGPVIRRLPITQAPRATFSNNDEMEKNRF